MFTMTYHQALEIQARQFDHYVAGMTQAGAFRLGNKLVKETGVLPAPISPDDQVPCSLMHNLVPRGGWFEYRENVAIMRGGRRNPLPYSYHPFRVTPSME